MKTFKISNKTVGENHPIFIIGEAGINHNGKLELAKKLVDIAADAGCDAVKFQTYKSEGVVAHSAESADYVNENLGSNISQFDLIKSYELKYEDFEELKKYCDNKGIIFLSTPHSFDAINFLDDLVTAYKFGSGDLTNIPALKHAAKKDKPIILGTGMSTIYEIKQAVNAIKSEGNDKIIALHCTTNYPCPIEEVNLNAMLTMKEELECLVGYSDHTLGIMIPILATAMGANVIEKHFTLDKNLPGPDHKASLDPDELKKMISEIRETELVLGSFDKKPTASEEKIKQVTRKSLIAKNNISKGTTITKDLIDIKRPGTGINPVDIEKIVGKKSKIDIDKDEILQFNMVE
jgi:N-acetylneuraminate synthase/N,N'-diacetyllegionaminate synthase